MVRDARINKARACSNNVRWSINSENPILDIVMKYVHTVSAIAFYVLGSTFFLAYIALHNNILAGMSTWWMNVADMPMLFVGMLYGGLSVYTSIHDGNEHSRGLILSIGLPLVIVFIALFILNF